MAITKVYGSVLANVEFSGDSLKIPVGTTAERPSIPSDGMMRYNTETNQFELYVNGVWVNTTIESDGAILVVSGTTADRPAAPTAGMFRYNTDESYFEGYDGSFWEQIGGIATVEYYNTSGIRSLILMGTFPFFLENGTFSPICLRAGNVPFVLSDGTDTYLKVN